MNRLALWAFCFCVAADANANANANANADADVSLADVFASVDAHHPLVVQALAERSGVSADALAADGAFDPVLRARGAGHGGYYANGGVDVGVDVPTPLWGTTFSGGYRLGAGDYPIYDGKQKTNDGGELRLGLVLPLLRDGAIDRRRAQVARLGLEERVQDEAVRLARLELRRAAAHAFAEWAGAVARVDVQRALLRQADERARALATRAAAGDVAAIDEVDNRRLVAQRRARLAAAERAAVRAALDLSLYLRDNSGAPRVLSTTSAVPIDTLATQVRNSVSAVSDVDAALAAARSTRPELVRVQHQRAQLDVDEALAENQLWPTLSLAVGVSQDFGGAAPPLSSSSSVWAADAKTRGSPELTVGVQFELPVPLRTARGQLAAVVARRARLDAQAALADNRVVVDVKDAIAAADAAAVRRDAAAAELAAADAVLHAERARFAAGDSTILLVNLREQAQAEAALAAVDAAVEGVRAVVALRAATGALLEEESR